jgi:hypothetical protein
MMWVQEDSSLLVQVPTILFLLKKLQFKPLDGWIDGWMDGWMDFQCFVDDTKHDLYSLTSQSVNLD